LNSLGKSIGVLRCSIEIHRTLAAGIFMDWQGLCIAFVSAAIATWVLPSVHVRRVGISLISLVQRFFTVTADTGVQAAEVTLYLTVARGLTRHLTSYQRIQYWRQAVQYTARLLKLRLRWHRLGIFLQTDRIQRHLTGVHRIKGSVIRTHNANSVAKVKARARAKQRTSASSASR
jgi:hypothetical protein